MLDKPRHFTLSEFEGARLSPFGSWRRAIAAVFDVGADPDDVGAFAGDVAAWSTERIMLSQMRSSHLRLMRSSDTLSLSRLDHIAVAALASGGIAGVAGGSEVEASAGDVVFLDLMQTLDLNVSPRGGETSLTTLWVPRHRMLSSIHDEHGLHGLVVRGASPGGAMIAGSLNTLTTQVPRMTGKELDTLADGAIELTARAAGPALEANASTRVAAPLASLVTIRRYIDRNLGSPELDADSIAKRFGLSRASLYRLFEPIDGIAAYIRKQRLNRAYQEITAAGLADKRIGPIAFRWGFKNVSAFSRLFRETYGMTPHEARTAATSNMRPGVVQFTSDDVGAGPLAQWLRVSANS